MGEIRTPDMGFDKRGQDLLLFRTWPYRNTGIPESINTPTSIARVGRGHIIDEKRLEERERSYDSV